jgi:two-component system cell cycle sensor histidine kinase/response regulator CckA
MIEVASSATGSAKSILVVDDDKDILKTVRIGLERAGFEVHGFSDPILALQHIEHGCNECEVLISDVRMPHMNGFQLVKRIRQIRPGMKLVMMTAFEINKAEFESVFPSTQIDSVLQKPFAPSKLVSVVEKVSKSDSIPQ